jgi:hypothetical protein
VDPVPDPLLLRKFGSAENRTRDLWVSSQELWPLDYRGGHSHYIGPGIIRALIIDIITKYFNVKQFWEYKIVNLSGQPCRESDSRVSGSAGATGCRPPCKQYSPYQCRQVTTKNPSLLLHGVSKVHNPAGIPTGYWLRGWRTGVRLRARVRDLFSSTSRHCREPLKAHSPEVNPIGHVADQSLASNAKIKNAWSYTAMPQTTLPSAVPE